MSVLEIGYAFVFIFNASTLYKRFGAEIFDIRFIANFLAT